MEPHQVSKLRHMLMQLYYLNDRNMEEAERMLYYRYGQKYWKYKELVKHG